MKKIGLVKSDIDRVNVKLAERLLEFEQLGNMEAELLVEGVVFDALEFPFEYEEIGDYPTEYGIEVVLRKPVLGYSESIHIYASLVPRSITTHLKLVRSSE